MARIIYSKNDQPILQADKKVSTFPGNLIRVDLNYVVKTSDVSKHSKKFKNGNEITNVDSPAIDKLYIFPEPQWEEQESGFTNISVSAYSISSKNPVLEFRVEELTATTINESADPPVVEVIPVTATVLDVRFSRLAGSQEIPNGVLSNVNSNIYNATGGRERFSNYPNATITQTWVSSGFTTTNFGKWEEVVATYAPSITIRYYLDDTSS